MASGKTKIEEQVRKAEEKLLGNKFCFSCQKHRPIASGKSMRRGRSNIWKCGECLAKRNPGGFTLNKRSSS